MSEPRRFWQRPSRRHLAHFARLATVVGAWFGLVYGGADWLTGQHAYRLRVHFDAELDIPFVPAAVLGYMSLYPLFAAAPFILRSGQELHALASVLAAVILVAGVCFLLLPAEAAYPPTADCGIWDAPVRFAKWLARPHERTFTAKTDALLCCPGAFAP